ncbi:MAG: hypothetical protein ACRDZS_02620 [Acidimicrobiales bacterium]
MNGFVGQLSDPYEQAEDDGLGITISGLPGQLDEPDEPEPEADAAPPGEPDTDDAGDTEVVYELDDWSEIERGAVTDRLREAGIPHGWDATSLLVSEADEAAVENILDIVEGDHEAALTLDTEQDQVAYDLSDWDDDRLTALVDELDAAGIAHGWDEDELFVYATDEQAVDELLDRVAHPHELPAETDEGPAGAELLGEVFVAADRLQHDPDDHEGTVSMLDLGHAVEAADPPYGLGSKEWDHLRGRVGALCSQLRASKVDEDAVMDAARDLRNALRSYV